MKVKFGKLFIPHLNYTVWVKPIKGRQHPDGYGDALAWVSRIDNRRCDVFLPANETPGSLAHELIHVLQFICAARHIDFILEQEHVGYLMQWLMGQILNYEWK